MDKEFFKILIVIAFILFNFFVSLLQKKKKQNKANKKKQPTEVKPKKTSEKITDAIRDTLEVQYERNNTEFSYDEPIDIGENKFSENDMQKAEYILKRKKSSFADDNFFENSEIYNPNKKIIEKENLRKYIVVSEILKKPKAFYI